MRVLACYVKGNMHRETYRSLNEHMPDDVLFELVDVSDSETAYWREVAKRWNGKQDLVTIEQDMEITAETIPSFRACDEPWCCFWYRGPSYGVLPEWLHGDVTNTAIGDLAQLRFALGCTKFSAGLQRAVSPGMIADSSQGWDDLDVKVRTSLVRAGYQPHVHGEVKTFHQYEIPFMEKLRAGNSVDIRYLDKLPLTDDFHWDV